MLKFIVTDIDSVDEAHRDLYEADGTGKHVLKVEGAVPKSQVQEFRDNNIKLKEQLEKFEGINPDKVVIKYVLPKGFISIDGCSLTVGEVDKNTGRFNVWLIPETLRVTVLGDKTVGDTVNVEIESQTQVIVDTIERYMAERGL